MTIATEPAVNAAPPHLLEAVRGAESICIKCGFCLPVCPTYRVTGAEAASPRGRLELMYATARGGLALSEIRGQLWLCLGCLACETACPAGIHFREPLEAARIDDARERRRAGHASRWKGVLLNRLLVSPRLLRWSAWTLYLFQSSGLRAVLGGRGLLRLLSPRLAGLERRTPPLERPRNWRSLARADLAEQPGLAEREQEPSKPAALLTGCVMDALFGEVHAATARVLAVNGHSVRLPAGQGCCGALHLHMGELEEAKALARRNIAAFEGEPDAPVIVNSAGCGAMMKAYGSLLAGEPQWSGRAHAFSARVRDVCEFLAETERVTPTRALPLKVAYDDPCHLLHAQKIGEAPRRLLAEVPGLELVPLAEAEWCCGSAGSYGLTQPEMSARLLARKMEHIRACGADVVATGNPGCLLQLRLGAREAGLAVKIVHPVELLAEAYGPV